MTENPKEDAYNWLMNIVLSCKNDFHFLGVDILIDLFKSKYSDDELVFNLKVVRNKLWDEIHVNLV